ncbi:MAG TPA: ABC transporter permease [Anaerolineae bacterium]|jgi:putative ABC transport system permease protein|nr:ABC transporter permease [Anaerolineae bacterium]
MKLTQILIEALESLNANKMRSGLTILGIVIGVAAVIAMLGVGNGAQASITGSINDIGTNILFVFSGNDEADVRNPRPLTLKDSEALADPFAAPSVQAVAPVIQGQHEVSGGGEKTNVQVSGIVPIHAQVRNELLSEGEFITESHLLGRASVAIIGQDTADAIFGRKSGVTGETIRIDGQPFRIIGVLESKGGGMMGSQDNRVLVPLTTAQTRLNSGSSDSVDIIYVQAVSAEVVPSAAEEVSQILRTRHRNEVGVDDFTVFTQQDFLSTAESITGVFTIFLGGIAAISLLVGGIGIMNIMLVSVVERTREIGLRKALGARKSDILTQFLAESSLLSGLGGVIGIVLGWLLAVGIEQISIVLDSPFKTAISLDSILLATLFSAAIGLFFGIYPANRAASLEPVEALRYE